MRRVVLFRTLSIFPSAMDALVTSLEEDLSFSLKPKQTEALAYLNDGEDVLCCLPTGYGKSLIFSVFPKLKQMVII